MPRRSLAWFAFAFAFAFVASRPASASSPWLERNAPQDQTVTLGAAAGLLLVNERHSHFHEDPARYLDGYKRLRGPNPALALRLGYAPLRFLAVEIEGTAVPTRLRDEPGTALIWAVRGQVVGRLGLWSVVPFALVGAGVLGVASAPAAVGDDVDPAVHFGGGLELALNRWVVLRLDLRDLVSNAQGLAAPLRAHNLEATLGLGLTLRPRQSPHR